MTARRPKSETCVVHFSRPGEPIFPTDLEKVIVAPETVPDPGFGILDLQPQDIHAPPQFTEEATIAAMRNLNVAPEDLVPQEPNISDVPLRVNTKLELERRRYQTIQNILAERNRILALPALEICLSNEPTVRRVRCKHQKKAPQPPPSPQLPAIVATHIKLPQARRQTRRRKVAVAIHPIDDDEAKRLRLAQIRQAAQCRMAKAMVEESALVRRRRQLREAAPVRIQDQARRYMRLQEKKQTALAAEREWRRANVYAGARDQKGAKKNSLSELRQKFLSALTQPPPRIESVRPPIQISDVAFPTQNRRTRAAQSLDAKWDRVTFPIIGSASIDQTRGGNWRPKLPIVGKGKTKIPQLRQ
jgi:hypothetical protein